MDKTNISKTIKIKSIVLLLASFVLGGVCAALRILVLSSDYIHSEGLYQNGRYYELFSAFAVGAGLVLFLLGLTFAAGKMRYTIREGSLLSIFANAFCGFCFLALAFSIFLSAKISGVGLARLDSVLVVLSLVCAVSFLLEAFSRQDNLSADALLIMMLSRPVVCLFISFYFYFDSSTVIHNSNKKVATLFFAIALLSLLYFVKLRCTEGKGWIFASVTAVSICYGITYVVPNLFWYFTKGEPMFLGIPFDVVGVALLTWLSSALLSLETPMVCENDQSIAECEPISNSEDETAENGATEDDTAECEPSDEKDTSADDGRTE